MLGIKSLVAGWKLAAKAIMVGQLLIWLHRLVLWGLVGVGAMNGSISTDELQELSQRVERIER